MATSAPSSLSTQGAQEISPMKAQEAIQQESSCVNGTKSKHEKGWRRIVRNFTPAWFSVNMGTGITSILLNSLPYNGRWLYWISVVIFCLNIVLFMIFISITILRYILYTQIFHAMVTHPAQSLFLGTLPMGMATLINMYCAICVPHWGDKSAYFAFAWWVVDAIISVATALGVPFIMMSHDNGAALSGMTAAWLLPIVACVVAAASGALVADVLPNPHLALGTIIASYVLWGIGVPLACMVMVIYLQRLMMHKLPPKAVAVSVFLPLGPLGQGGFGVQKLGVVAKKIFPLTGSLDSPAGELFYNLGFFIALIMWGFGLIWVFFALATLIRFRKFPFNLGWWAFTFPLGVFTTCTIQMGEDLPSSFFRVLGTIFSVTVTLMWLLVSFHTLKGVFREGEIFVAPCLANLEEKWQKNEKAKDPKV